ncbi:MULTISPECIES: hypothetical protein [unclassified Duganella]|nr:MULTISPECIES: hypothetical protein [unclassified Duganella]
MQQQTAQRLLLFGAEVLHGLRIQRFGLASDLLLDGTAGGGQPALED